MLLTFIPTFRSGLSREDSSPSCSEKKAMSDQEKFQQCSHSITAKLHHSLDHQGEKVEADMVTACRALEDISRECVGHLAACLDQEDLDITRKLHVDRQTEYFTRLLGLTLDCQDEDYHRDEASTDTLLDIMTEEDEEEKEDEEDEEDERNKKKSQPLEESRRNTASKVTQETAEFEKSFSESSYVNFLLLLYSPIKILLL